jgi:hypothetical protein
MSLDAAGEYFGYTPKAFRCMIYRGELIYGTHFMKAGKKILIIVKGFKIFLHAKAGLTYGES